MTHCSSIHRLREEFSIHSYVDRVRYSRVAVVVVMRPSRLREDTGGTETGYSTEAASRPRIIETASSIAFI